MENILRNVSNLRNNGYILCKIHRRLLLKMKEIAFCGGTCPWTPYIYHPPPTSTPPIGDPAGATANGAIFQLFIILVEDFLDFILKALVIWYIYDFSTSVFNGCLKKAPYNFTN